MLVYCFCFAFLNFIASLGVKYINGMSIAVAPLLSCYPIGVVLALKL